MRGRWLVRCLNTFILIILIQEPEPSGSEAGESQVRNRVWEILRIKRLTHAVFNLKCGIIKSRFIMASGSHVLFKRLLADTQLDAPVVNRGISLLNLAYTKSNRVQQPYRPLSLVDSQRTRLFPISSYPVLISISSSSSFRRAVCFRRGRPIHREGV
jgi:hypothetical protein